VRSHFRHPTPRKDRAQLIASESSANTISRPRSALIHDRLDLAHSIYSQVVGTYPGRLVVLSARARVAAPIAPRANIFISPSMLRTARASGKYAGPE
jgi:hypothetical protein